MGKSMHHASLKKLCLKKECGGLGLRNFNTWNRVAYQGLVFDIAYKKQSVWVAYTWVYQIRNKGFWTMSIPSNCSWVWRAVLKMRDQEKQHIKFLVADGKDFMLWDDP
ncbi:Zf-rvt domain-containing protein [Thalictrum thalictroides]|uniref:Zf-rvt domain-containing protein n=1 Tax=Thalictrum thalictroides TaxID=46969 RepID=A0A7J6W4H7_THATH|nr:Zf-rvt domain-containing protein [Thalictrum thalictroides]